MTEETGKAKATTSKPKRARTKRSTSSSPPTAEIPLGFKLLATLPGNGTNLLAVAWSPDGQEIAASHFGTGTNPAAEQRDYDIFVWDCNSQMSKRVLKGHKSPAWHIIFLNNRSLISAAIDQVQVWDSKSGEALFELQGGSSADSEDPNIYTYSLIKLSDDTVALGLNNGSIEIWKLSTKSRQILKGEEHTYDCLVSASANKILAAGSQSVKLGFLDGNLQIEVLDIDTQKQILSILDENAGRVMSLAYIPDTQIIIAGCKDGTIRLFELASGKPLSILEGHAGMILSFALSSDRRILASKSSDDTIRLWRVDTWETIAVLREEFGHCVPTSIAFHPTMPDTLATFGDQDRSVRIWQLDLDVLLGSPAQQRSVYYTTAKIALVGDTAVGKSGLGYRIAEDAFRVTESTHGQQFWVIDSLGKQRSDGTQCEAVLWDFAGQTDFRPIHALFLDDVDLALVLFDPARPDTLKGVSYWLKQLDHSQQPKQVILVPARTDVSPLTFAPGELQAFCKEHHISGGFIATSAKAGEGVAALLERIRGQIDWEAKPTTVTTETFKRIKDYVLALKANADRKNLLVSPAQLRAQLEAADPDWQFSDAEMLAAVGHLQNHGYVTILRRSAEEQSILLAPDVLINLAASFVLKAKTDAKGLGALEEAKALQNKYRFPEVAHLTRLERDTLLRAATELFLKHNICFRESVDNRAFLIFPSLILDRPPRLLQDADLVEKHAYLVSGAVENVYAALVVLLGYSPNFQRMNQWRKQAQYETVRGEICGFKLIDDDPTELELVLYYGKETPEYVQARFQGLFEEILYSRNVTVRKFSPIICPKCHRQQERRTVIRRVKEGKDVLFCDECGERIALPSVTERVPLSSADRALVTRDQTLARLRTSYETALVRVKGFLRDRGDTGTKTCFISYAWGNEAHARWVQTLADDLRNADIDVILDRWTNLEIGANVARFVSRIEQSHYVAVVGTPTYRQKYENKVSESGSVVASEVDLIHLRLTGTEAQKASVLPLLLEGDARTSFPPLLRGRVFANFTRQEDYFFALFDLLLTLYQIPFYDPIVRDLREKLEQEARMFAGTHL